VKYLYPKVIACVMFVMDASYRLVAECFGFFPPNFDAAIAITTLYAIGAVVVTAATLVFFCFIDVGEDCPFKIFTWMLQVFLVLVYYFGKNAGGMARHYWTFLGCTEEETSSLLHCFARFWPYFSLLMSYQHCMNISTRRKKSRRCSFFN